MCRGTVAFWLARLGSPSSEISTLSTVSGRRSKGQTHSALSARQQGSELAHISHVILAKTASLRARIDLSLPSPPRRCFLGAVLETNPPRFDLRRKIPCPWHGIHRREL
jgi:hypothetical protein